MGEVAEQVTAEIARRLGRLVREGLDAALVLECVLAMFAQGTGLVPPGTFTAVLQEADRTGRMRGLPVSPAHLRVLRHVADDFDWRDVRPEIFGSIFERALRKEERHDLGAHFTREADIAKVVGPTVLDPWRARIEASRSQGDLARVAAEMKRFHVLDPASGSGNFLHVVHREMRRLEGALLERWHRASGGEALPAPPYFTVRQLHGIEKNALAAALSRLVLWMGEHLSRRETGDPPTELPDENILHADALFADWYRPEGELAIVGNPPFLGVRKMRSVLGDAYVERLFARYPQNRSADYVTYWFARALEVLRPGERAGFVATNSIAQNESRAATIDRIIAGGGTVTDAWRSYPWPGAAVVHVGIVSFVMAAHGGRKTLDGREVEGISPSLTDTVDVTAARNIERNAGLCFMGVTPGNRGLVLDEAQRREILALDPASAEVIKPFLVGRDLNREVDQRPTRWIIDFGTMDEEDASRFVGAMRHVRRYVYPVQSRNRRASRAGRWWRFAEPAPKLRRAIASLERVAVMPCVAPNLVVSRQETTTCFDHQLMVVALGTHYDFGVLQSRLHETWAWARGSTFRGDLRYTNSTVFETFPFPLQADGGYEPRRPPETEPARRLAAAAEAFDEIRAATCRREGVGLTKVHNRLEAEDGAPKALWGAYVAMNDAADACYGFPPGTWRDASETLRRLLCLNRRLT